MARNANHPVVRFAEYRAWVSMVSACTNPKDGRWGNNGGSGIKVCDRWLNSFENFLEDIGLKTDPLFILNRRDRTKDFTPENTFWGRPQKTLKHGFYLNYPEYAIWKLMIGRCDASISGDSPQWKDYGGRGITVCQEWKDDFLAFIRDVGRRPRPGLLLDRIDNDGNYVPGNVRWATREESVINSRSTKYRGNDRWIRPYEVGDNHFRVRIGGHHVGVYGTIEEARVARNTAYLRLRVHLKLDPWEPSDE